MSDPQVVIATARILGYEVIQGVEYKWVGAPDCVPVVWSKYMFDPEINLCPPKVIEDMRQRFGVNFTDDTNT